MPLSHIPDVCQVAVPDVKVLCECPWWLTRRFMKNSSSHQRCVIELLLYYEDSSGFLSCLFDFELYCCAFPILFWADCSSLSVNQIPKCMHADDILNVSPVPGIPFWIFLRITHIVTGYLQTNGWFSPYLAI